MPTGQALINLLQSTGAIKYAPGARPAFTVNFGALRLVLRPEQSAMLAAARAAITPLVVAGTPAARPNLSQRTDIGTMTFNVPGIPQPVSFPTIVLLGADGAGSRPTLPGLSRRGESVTLDERTKHGHILIAAAGNGGPGTDGGGATAIGGGENLIVALGGDGYTNVIGGQNGSDGGDGIGQAIEEANEVNAQGGVGGNGAPGAAGAPAATGVPAPFGLGVPAVPASPGGSGGAGGHGGKAVISGGDNNFARALGGAGGSGAIGGPGGAGAAATLVPPWPAIPAGPAGVPADGGDGGNYKITLGAKGIIDASSGGGAAGLAGATPPASPGAAGVKE